MAVGKGEFDPGFAHTEDPSRSFEPTSADASLERFDHCHSLGKEQSGACFRDMAAMLMEEIAVQKEENSVQKGEIAMQKDEIVVQKEEIAMQRGEIASLVSANVAVEIRETERHSFLEPTSVGDQSSDDAQLQGPPPPHCFWQSD
jgi:hypothetical protein